MDRSPSPSPDYQKSLPKGAIVRLKTPISEMVVVEDDGAGSVLVVRHGISGWISRDDIEIP